VSVEREPTRSACFPAFHRSTFLGSSAALGLPFARVCGGGHPAWGLPLNLIAKEARNAETRYEDRTLLVLLASQRS